MGTELVVWEKRKEKFHWFYQVIIKILAHVIGSEEGEKKVVRGWEGKWKSQWTGEPKV